MLEGGLASLYGMLWAMCMCMCGVRVMTPFVVPSIDGEFVFSFFMIHV